MTHRRSICRWLVGIIVSAQLAVAGFACAAIPGARMHVPAGSGAGAMLASGSLAPGPSGGGTDSASPNLCVAHCQYGQQNLDSSSEVDVPPALLTTLYMLPPPSDGAALALPLAAPRHPAAAAGPPHAILHCCLRN